MTSLACGKDFADFIAIFCWFYKQDLKRLSGLGQFLHPYRHILTHALLEGIAESGVVVEAAILSQAPDDDVLLGSDGPTVEADEMVDAQTVDIGIVSSPLPGEIPTEVEAVGTDNRGKLMDGQVVLQV